MTSAIIKKNLGMWEKGEAIGGEFRGVESPTYRQLEKETGRDRRAFFEWLDARGEKIAEEPLEKRI